MTGRSGGPGLAALVMLTTGGAIPSGAAADVPLSAVEPPSREGAVVAKVMVPTWARVSLADPRRVRRVRVVTPWSGQPQQLLVLGKRVRHGEPWVRVRLPDRPNGTAGWVRVRSVRLFPTRWSVEVLRGARRVRIFRDGRLVRRFRAVVGAPGTPTPLGLAALLERNRQADPRGFLGPWALALTIHSTVLENYGGGPGRVAIHGRNGASLLDPLGTARSRGCIRVADRHISWMARRLPLGTPVRIRR